MIGISYNPFPVEINDLEPMHLSVLRDVAEGWYIEYKSRIIQVRNIAKSISAFSNHYGGWVFYGIEEAKDGSNTAGNFPGLLASEITLLIERIRNAAKDSVQPSPYYEYKVISGPCEEIGLAEDKSIVVVVIPAGPDPPYIHNDGRIYRRVADSSDPKPETDRFILDQLWQRGQKARRELELFLSNKPHLSREEEEFTYLDLFLLVDPLNGIRKNSTLSFDNFVELMKETEKPGINITYDNFFSMSDGYICRQTGDDPNNFGLTWKHFRDGSSIISFPISSEPAFLFGQRSFSHDYKHTEEIIDLLRKQGHDNSLLIDITPFPPAIAGIINRQRRLMKEGGLGSLNLYGKASIHNIFRRIPYIDVDIFIQFVTENGFPIIQFSDELAPPGLTFESLVLIPERKSRNEEEILVDQLVDSASLLGPIINALGIPFLSMLGKEDSEVGSLWEASFRAAGVNWHNTSD